MKKYVIKPRKLDKQKLFDYYDDNGVIYDLTVYEEEISEEDSGILDSSGDKIYKVIEKEPIGYLNFDEETDE